MMSPQQSIAHYRIISKLGEGGMGEVWRATDTKLSRDVAIKVLPESLAVDPDRLARFTREAQVLASLNHPNIAAIYGVEDRALIMELIEGAPLKGPIPLSQVVAYASQILDALDAAHRKGITHRDLKPANILVTKQGIKLLDFGLAKQSALQETDATMTAGLTQKGQIVGTLQYMSPEQLQGKEADARSDLFSFGCVLYEMLTGKCPFEGQSGASVIAAILEREPPMEAGAPLERVVRRCLSKDPDKRFQNARDLQSALLWSVEQPQSAAAVPTRHTGRWIIAAVLGVVAAVALWAPWRAKPSLQPLARLDVDLGSDVSLGSSAGADVILSPDGTRMAYVSNSRLFTRRLDESKAVELPGTEGAFAPFFKPDGQWIGFFARGKLKKVAVQGGTAITLCDATVTSAGGSWGEDDNIVASLTPVGGLSRVSAADGRSSRITDIDRDHGELAHKWPQILPGGKAVLLTGHRSPVGGWDDANVEVVSLRDRRLQILVRGGTYGRYLPSGHLVYVSRGTLFAVPFDLQKLEVRGTPAPVLGDVAYRGHFGSAQIDFPGGSSAPGTLVYRPGGAGVGMVAVQRLDPGGNLQPLISKPGEYAMPRLSPDGQRLVLVSGADISIYDSRRDILTPLGSGSSPVWSPEGGFIVFESQASLFYSRPDGGSQPQALTRSKNRQVPWSFTPDGKRLAFMEADPETGLYHLWTLSMQRDGADMRAGQPELFLKTPADTRHPAFSSDGRWLAYSSNESGPYQVWVRAFPDKGVKWQISRDGGMYPVWSRSGHMLLFRGDGNRVMTAAFSIKGDTFAAETPRSWSEKQLADIGSSASYDVAPDGKHIVAIMPVESENPKARHEVVFLLNFFDELRRRAPLNP